MFPKNDSLREKYPYSEFFWSVFSRIRIEYGEVPLSLRIQPMIELTFKVRVGETFIFPTPHPPSLRILF